jgi:FkbM family methyltransferase
VFAFEPVRATAEALVRTRAANALEQLTVVPMALNDQPRSSAIRVPSIRGMADSTLIARGSDETISAVSLDACWPELADRDARIDGVKIDVQGMELQVLSGMQRLLTAWAPKLIIEFHHGVDRTLVLDLLVTAGYSNSYQAIDGDRPGLADDNSYFFEPNPSECASWSTRSITGRS